MDKVSTMRAIWDLKPEKKPQRHKHMDSNKKYLQPAEGRIEQTRMQQTRKTIFNIAIGKWSYFFNLILHFNWSLD